MYIDKSCSSELTEDSSCTFASHADSDQDNIDITSRQRYLHFLESIFYF